MRPFEHERPGSTEHALEAIHVHGGDTRFLAGGTNLVDLMKSDVARPERLVDLGALPLRAIETVDDGSLLLGALATNADTAAHPLVRLGWPPLSAAILAGASPQIRNRATNGGNLLQRTRCSYFVDPQVPCNKRLPGSGCPARGGLARGLAILGTSEHCIATHPSDFCVALAALDATVHVRSAAGGGRTIPMTAFHRLPGDRPETDTELAPDELVTHLTVPRGHWGRHASYLKLRERTSYAFAIVSVAAALELGADGRVQQARLALGGVASRPWRVPEAEALLAGQAPTRPAFEAAAQRLLDGAQAHGAPGSDNAYKIPLAARAVVRALEMALAGIPTQTGPIAARHPEAR